MNEPNRPFYTTGGTVISGVYIEREADRLLLENCLQGEYSAVLTSRQMGKTSLMYRTRARLLAEQIHVTTVDLHLIGESDASEQWFPSFLSIIADDLELEIDVGEWWQAQHHLTPIYRMVTFFYKEVLLKKEFPIVIFLDEIESIRGRAFANDFFAAVRALYNSRKKHPELQRLAFVLLGCVLPYQLISDSRKTSYNIGKFINLTDFTPAEARPLLERLDIPSDLAEQVLEWILDWTDGQPYLTQVVCHELFRSGQPIRRREQVDAAVARLLTSEDYKGKHLKYLQTWLTDPQSGERVLRTYGFILENAPVADQDRNQTLNELKLIGVVKPVNAQLRVRNKIYRQTLDRNWTVNELTRAGAAVPQDFSRARIFLEEPAAEAESPAETGLPAWLAAFSTIDEVDAASGLEHLIDTLQAPPSPAGPVEEAAPASESELPTVPISEKLVRRRESASRFSWLAQADIPIRSREFLLLILVLLLLPLIVSALLGWSLSVGIFLGTGGAIGLTWMVLGRRSRRWEQFNRQLPDMLDLMVSGLRAGFSTIQAMEAVSRELPPPASGEFRRVVQEIQIGVSMQQALGNLARRVPSVDLHLVVTAIQIQREVGGNLTEILDTIANLLRQREYLQGELRILENLPFWLVHAAVTLMAVMQWVFFPGYFGPAWEQPAGRAGMGWVYWGLSAVVGLAGFAAQRIDQAYLRVGRDFSARRARRVFADILGTGFGLLAAALLGVPEGVLTWLMLLSMARSVPGALIWMVGLGGVLIQASGLLSPNWPEWLVQIWNRLAPLAEFLQREAASGAPAPVSWGVMAAGLLVGIGLVWFLLQGRSESFKERFLSDAETQPEIATLEKLELRLPFGERMIQPGLRALQQAAMGLTPGAVYRATARRLERAQMPAWFTPWAFFVLQILSAGLLGLVSQLAWGADFAWLAGALLVGLVLPLLWLAARIASQKDQRLDELPDALDLLTVCVEAGLNFDSALYKVGQTWDSGLSRDFGEVVREIQLGRLRRDALLHLAEKIDLAEMHSFVAAVVLGEQLGVSMARTLRIQSEQIRTKLRQQVILEGNRVHALKQLLLALLLGPLLLFWVAAPLLSRILLK